MSVVAILGETFNLLLGITEETLKRLPTYDQKKREKFHLLKMELVNELKKEYRYRDDDRILYLRDELRSYVKAFQKELSSEKVTR